MSSSVKSFNPHTWLKATAQLMLLWVICQSALAATMPIAMENDCCPSDASHAMHEHSMPDASHLHEKTPTMASMDSHDDSYHDHSDCEHCTLGCQFVTSVAADAIHEFTAQATIAPSVSPLVSSSLDLPFRPPILF